MSVIRHTHSTGATVTVQPRHYAANTDVGTLDRPFTRWEVRVYPPGCTAHTSYYNDFATEAEARSAANAEWRKL